jgi:hypothetical protein
LLEFSAVLVANDQRADHCKPPYFAAISLSAAKYACCIFSRETPTSRMILAAMACAGSTGSGLDRPALRFRSAILSLIARMSLSVKSVFALMAGLPEPTQYSPLKILRLDPALIA